MPGGENLKVREVQGGTRRAMGVTARVGPRGKQN